MKDQTKFNFFKVWEESMPDNLCVLNGTYYMVLPVTVL